MKQNIIVNENRKIDIINPTVKGLADLLMKCNPNMTINCHSMGNSISVRFNPEYKTITLVGENKHDQNETS